MVLGASIGVLFLVMSWKPIQRTYMRQIVVDLFGGKGEMYLVTALHLFI